MLKRSLLLATILLSISCTKSPSWKTMEWQGEGSAPLPASMLPTESTVRLKTNDIRFYQQQVAGVRVAGSFGKTVENKKLQNWASFRLLDEANGINEGQVKSALEDRKDAVLAAKKSLNQIPCPISESRLENLEPEIQWVGRKWDLTYFIECEDKSGQTWRVLFDKKGNLLNVEETGSQFASSSSVQVNAVLYPTGPKTSTLKSLKLTVAAQPNYLSLGKLAVVSDAGAKLTELNSVPGLKPGDIRFDLLQVYYASSQALNWTTDTFQFEPRSLKIRTHVGYPDSTNAAFYFRSEIRLGAGDGKSFAQMSLDPSIVGHEAMHAVIDGLAALPFQGEGGSLNEGLADSLIAHHLSSPRLGENAYLKGPYQRTLENNLNFNSRTGALYGDSLVLSGLIWEIHEKVGTETSQRLILHLLTYLTPGGNFKVAKELVQQWLTLEKDQPDYKTVAEVIERRGWL